MNHFSTGSAQGYAETWNEYKEGENYKYAYRRMINCGLTDNIIDRILEDAFNAGWSLLITTFIGNITENEKRLDKKAHLTHTLEKKYG